ncbi:MAG: hypothetical protein OXP75_01295 [Rhodospirillales bacterium]|nr:hypothetical protein [Rhodospirillales bacterium]
MQDDADPAQTVARSRIEVSEITIFAFAILATIAEHDPDLAKRVLETIPRPPPDGVESLNIHSHAVQVFLVTFCTNSAANSRGSGIVREFILATS